MNISAVIVTRGDRDIGPVVASLKHFDEVLVWDNTKAIKDLKVFGRYAAAFCARNPVIYTQDDDCIVPSGKIVDDFLGYSGIVCNFPVDRRSEYHNSGITLVGWGMAFRRYHLGNFRAYLDVHPHDDLFLRECDRVFSYLNRDRIQWVDHGVVNMDYAYGTDRMGREPQHAADLKQIKERLRETGL